MAHHHQQILSLIEDSPEFTYLHNHFNRFNPFKVLQVDNYEIRHSNVLAWLLDPKQNHNLGPYFINKLLSKVFVNPANYEDEDKIANYDVLQLSRNSYHDLVVFKELLTNNKKRIDILAVSKLQKIAVLIENKFWSSESEGQLEEYIEFVKKRYEGYKIIPIFLTLQDEEPTHEDYLMLGYSDVLGILHNLIRSDSDYMNKDVASFISYYIDILEDQLIQNIELNECAMSLYKNHKEAIELLSSVGRQKRGTTLNYDDELIAIYRAYKESIDFLVTVGNSFLKEAFIKFAASMEWQENLYTSHFKLPNFIEPKWEVSFDEEDLREKWWMNKGLITWFEQSGDRLKLKLEVGPLHQEKRENLLHSLLNLGVDIKGQAFEEGRKYTRIYMDADVPASFEDIDSLAKSMRRLYMKDSFQALLDKISVAIDLMDGGVVENSAIQVFNPMEQAFLDFVQGREIDKSLYHVNKNYPSFVEEEWTRFPPDYRVIETYWLGYPLIAWFRRRNSTVRLIIEVGPMLHEQRIKFLEKLEDEGVTIRALAYEEGRRFTRIYSEALQVADMDDSVELAGAMNRLVQDQKYQVICSQISRAITALGMES